jgi:hypothetical protein
MIELEGEQPFMSEGQVVRRYQHPDLAGDAIHIACGAPWNIHGWIDETDTTVCPSDWVLTLRGGGYAVVPTDVAHSSTEALLKYVADCRGALSHRQTFESGFERDGYANAHTAETGHVVDRYAVEV